MIAQSTSRLRLGPVKTEPAQIKLIDKDIDYGRVAGRLPSGSGLKHLSSDWWCLIAIVKL